MNGSGKAVGGLVKSRVEFHSRRIPRGRWNRAAPLACSRIPPATQATDTGLSIWCPHLRCSGITNPKTVFISRFTRTVNCCTTWMVKTRTLPAGCALFAARDTKENRIFSLFSTTRKFTTERSMIFLLVQNFSCGTRTHTHSIWGYR